MSSDIDEFLDEVDKWKFKAHERLKGLTAKQRQAFWARIRREAREMGRPFLPRSKGRNDVLAPRQWVRPLPRCADGLQYRCSRTG